MAANPNYEAIEGVHTFLEELVPASGRVRRVPVVMQMKAYKSVTKRNVEEWAKAAHKSAQNVQGLKKGAHYVVLYLPKFLGGSKAWESCIPKGSVVIIRH